MTIKGKIKEAIGYLGEEMHEKRNPKKAQEYRDMRNEGRIEDDKMPKVNPPGTENPD